MSRRLVVILVAAVAVAFAASAWAQAQGTPMKIGFSFFAKGKEMPKGTYLIEVTSAGHVVLRSEKGGNTADLTPLKSLGRDDKLQEPKLVFDTVGAFHFLCEVWLPGQEGYQVGSSTGEHDQEIVGGAKNRK